MRESELIIYNFEEELSDDDVKTKVSRCILMWMHLSPENIKSKNIYGFNCKIMRNYFLGLKESN